MSAQTDNPPQELYKKCNSQLTKAVSRWKDQLEKRQEFIGSKSYRRQIRSDDSATASATTKVPPISILVVDDHACIHDSVELLLEDQERYELSGAETLEEMWSQLATKEFDVILLDIHLPDGNGLEVVPRIRRLRPEIRIVPLTIEKDPDYIASHAGVGLDGWIPKGPQFPEQLTRVIKRVLNSTRGQPCRTLHLPTHISDVYVTFIAGCGWLLTKERRYLGQIIETIPLLPQREARYCAAHSLGISESSLKDYHKDIELSPFSTIQKAICAALAIAVQWMDPTLSLIQVADRVASYSGRALNKLTRRVFGTTLCSSRKIRDIRSLVTDTPFTISFIVEYPEGSEIAQVGIQAIMRKNEH